MQLGHVITVLHVVRDDPLAIAWQSTDGLHLRVQIAAAAALDVEDGSAKAIVDVDLFPELEVGVEVMVALVAGRLAVRAARDSSTRAGRLGVCPRLQRR